MGTSSPTRSETLADSGSESDVAVNLSPRLSTCTEWASQYQPMGSNLNAAELARMEEQFKRQQMSQHPSNFAGEFPPRNLVWTRDVRLTTLRSAEFSQQRQFSNPSPIQSSSPAPAPSMAAASFSRPGFAPSYGSYSQFNTRPMPSAMYQQPLRDAHGANEVDTGKGKSRFVELDDKSWEEGFARAASTSHEQSQNGPVEDQEVTKANLLSEGEIDLDATESDAQLMKDLEATWSQLKGQLDASSQSDKDLAQWEAQYGSQFNDLHLSEDEGEDGMFGLPETLRRGKEWTRENVDSFLTDQSPFPFSEENKYLASQDPYEEGLRLLSEGAPLSEAALAFEAACRNDETRAEAWKAAGETWAADEREAKGIRALEKAVACGGPHAVAAWMVSCPFDPLWVTNLLIAEGILDAAQSLAVAYVNEGQELRALATLEKWISLSYPTISLPSVPRVGDVRSPWDASNRVIDLFLAAAQAGPQSRAEGQLQDRGAIVDPDVQVGLGVLFYSNSDYERAKDCFEAALSVRPDVSTSVASFHHCVYSFSHSCCRTSSCGTASELRLRMVASLKKPSRRTERHSSSVPPSRVQPTTSACRVSTSAAITKRQSICWRRFRAK